jgi:hypothetical protein
MRQRFLTVFDYGTGGVWWYVTADSAEEITDKFRDIKIVEDPARWPGAGMLRMIEEKGVLDVSDAEVHSNFFARMLRRST